MATMRLTKSDGTVVDLPHPFAGGLNQAQVLGLVARALVVDAGRFSVTLDTHGRPTVTLDSGAAVTIDTEIDITHKDFLLGLHDPAELAAMRLA